MKKNIYRIIAILAMVIGLLVINFSISTLSEKDSKHTRQNAAAKALPFFR